MNKNTEVLVSEYLDNLGVFSKIYEIKNIDYAPLIINKNKEDIIKVLNDWFKGRGIPLWRDKLDLLLHRLNISAPSELLDKAFGLSLSDQYWLKPYNLDICYDDINFFDNDFEYTKFMEASLSKNSKIITNDKALGLLIILLMGC